jgi:hypothetical protein
MIDLDGHDPDVGPKAAAAVPRATSPPDDRLDTA